MHFGKERSKPEPKSGKVGGFRSEMQWFGTHAMSGHSLQSQPYKLGQFLIAEHRKDILPQIHEKALTSSVPDAPKNNHPLHNLCVTDYRGDGCQVIYNNFSSCLSFSLLFSFLLLFSLSLTSPPPIKNMYQLVSHKIIHDE